MLLDHLSFLTLTWTPPLVSYQHHLTLRKYFLALSKPHLQAPSPSTQTTCIYLWAIPAGG